MECDSIDRNIELIESGELLTQTEKDICQKILEAGNKFLPPAVARIAGGWVRDKLLGQSSDDIDICIDGCSARDFGKALSDQFPDDKTKIVTLEANPSQCKNMQTVRVCIFGDKWIDICNLRGDAGSQEQGTPLSDAQHRDFAINALFYNITESKVEDFVGGIPDLKAGIIRTPIDPNLTFTEDPLRIIRAARFRARLGYEYDPSIIDSAKEHLELFASKITRERITQELTKIIEKNAIVDFLKFTISIGFFEIIFDPQHLWNLNPEEALARVEELYSKQPEGPLLALSFAAIYRPIEGSAKHSDPEHPKKMMPPVEYAIAREMKMPIRVANDAATLIHGASKLNNLQEIINSKVTDLAEKRVIVGRWVREVGDLWHLVHYIAPAEEAVFATGDLAEFINAENLGKAHEMKALLNGSELGKLHGIRPGPGVRALVEGLVDWQLRHPEGTREDYEEEVKSSKQ